MGVFNAVMSLSGTIDTDIIEQEKLARHTSYRICLLYTSRCV